MLAKRQIDSSKDIVHQILRSLLALLRTHFLLLMILSLALYMRIVFPTGVVRGDDVIYAKYAYTILAERSLSVDLNIFVRFGLFLPVSFLYAIFGISETSTLIFPVAGSLLGIVFVYLIGRKLGNDSVAIIAALLWSLFPLNLALATQLLPDGIVTTLSLGAVYFYLRATETTGKESIGLALLCLIFLAWAIFSKITALVTAGFLGAHYLLGRIATQRKAQILAVAVKNREKVIGIFILLAYVYVVVQAEPFFKTLASTSTDIFQTFFWGTSPFIVGQRDKAFDAFIPIVMMSMPFFLMRLSSASNFVLLWFGMQFLYLEWGSQLNVPYGLNLLQYTPLSHWVENRTTLILIPPLILLVALYLSKMLSPKDVNRATGILVVLIAIIVFSAQDQFWAGEKLAVLEIPFALIFPLSLIGLVFVGKPPSKYGRVLFAALLFSLCFAEIRIYRSHPVERQNQKSLAQNLRSAADYLLTSNSSYQIVTSSPNRLEFASDFRLNYNDPKIWIDYETPSQIMEISQFGYEESAYIVVPARSSYVDNNTHGWWLVDRFGKETLEPVMLFLYFSRNDAEGIIEQSGRAGGASIDSLMAAALRLGDVHKITEYWNQWINTEPDPQNIFFVEEALKEYVQSSSSLAGDNLLTQTIADQSLMANLESQVELTYEPEEASQFSHVQVVIPWQYERQVFISAAIALKPDTLYYYETLIQSTIPVEPLRLTVPEESKFVRDSINLATRYSEITPITAIFMTPTCAGLDCGLEVGLVNVEPHNLGMVTLINPSLFEIYLNP